jgi:hypothetical protein
MIENKTMERRRRSNVNKFNLCVCSARKCIVNVWTAQKHKNVLLGRRRRRLAAARAGAIALFNVDKLDARVRWVWMHHAGDSIMLQVGGNEQHFMR